MMNEMRMSRLNQRAVDGRGAFIVYWMNSFRRLHSNFALERAVAESNRLGKPLLVLETWETGSPWSSPRETAHILQGMREHAAAAARHGRWAYRAVLERRPGEVAHLVPLLARRACCVVADDFPDRCKRRLAESVGRSLPVKMLTVDSNGLLPLRRAGQVFATAYAFRRFLQSHLRDELVSVPLADPLQALQASTPPDLSGFEAEGGRFEETTPVGVSAEWAPVLPHACQVGPVAEPTGPLAGSRALDRFLSERLSVYAAERNQPDRRASSELSGFLHHGQLSVHDIFQRLARQEEWNPSRLSARSRGRREGWWGMSPGAEAFLDELITWRELGYNMASQLPDYDQWSSLPGWARITLEAHAVDPRSHLYSLEAFEAAATHDELWNAAQRQLLREGRIHNYLRMLWGKKILEWTRSPREALEIMIELNNRYAIDGQDPNSYSGIFWVLGRYDRPWGPERPVFGKIRYMSSQNTARKVRVAEYLRRYGA